MVRTVERIHYTIGADDEAIFMKGRRVCLFFCCMSVACERRGAASDNASAEPVTQLREIGVLREPDGIPYEADPAGGAITHDGSVAFADNANQQVVLFDTTGKQIHALGRKGQGPGEFEYVEAVFPITPDSLAVFDRQRQSMSFVVQSRISPTTLAFNTWEFERNTGLRLVGRFKNGEWVALRSAPRNYMVSGVRSVVDTPVVVVGFPTSRPRELFKLAPRRMVDIMSAGVSYRTFLSDLSPAIGAVCELGVVLVDTSGVKYLGTRGETISSFPLPVSRVSVERLSGGRDGIVDRALYQARSSPDAGSARKFLTDWASQVDSIMAQPSLDAEGRSWWPTFAERGTAYIRVDHQGSVTGRFSASRGPMLIGRQTYTAMGLDSTTQSLAFSIYRLPRNDTVSAPVTGWCSGPFRY